MAAGFAGGRRVERRQTSPAALSPSLTTGWHATCSWQDAMTAASLFAPVLPPGTLPARAARGEGPSDGAGLFALLLAGAPPVQADLAQGDPGPSPRPASALAPPLARHLAPAAAPSHPATQLQEPPIPGTLGPEPPETASAATGPPRALTLGSS